VSKWFVGQSVLGLAIVLTGCGNGNSASSGTTKQSPPVAVPAISLAGGTYSSVQTVTLTDSTPGATIYYTTDGSNPSIQSPQYSGPITVSVSETLKAIALATGYSGSNVASATYVLSLNPGVALTGTVSSGTLPISGADVYLFAAGATGYGQPSLSLLNTGSTGFSDTLGAYVQTTSNGSFSITGDYGCAAGQQLYLYALGGTSGSGSNPSAGLLSTIGSCPASGATISATINEVTTVATAYALAGFATDATHVSSSGTVPAQTGVANAFATAANLVNMSTAPVTVTPSSGGSAVTTPGGAAYSITPSGTGTVPQTNINVIANILASCVNTQSYCNTLFTTATADSTTAGTKPTDTASAAINIAHYPMANYTALTALVGSSPTFTPVTPLFFTGSPSQFSLPVLYLTPYVTGLPYGCSIAIDGMGDVWVTSGPSSFFVYEQSNTGTILSHGIYGFFMDGRPLGIAIDSAGDAWVADEYSDISEISTTGAVSPITYDVSPVGIAIDASGNVWAANSGGVVTETSSTGTLLSPFPGFTGGGLSETQWIAIDSSGDAWATNPSNNTVTEISNSGSFLSPTNGFTSAGFANPLGIAIDASGTAWVVNALGPNLVEITSSGSVSYVPVNGLTTAWGIAIDGSGNGWIAATTSLVKVNKAGTILGSFTGTTTLQDFYKHPIVPAGSTVAIDGSGNAWTVAYNQGYAVEWVGAATPVVTPLATAVKNKTIATRP
jgi:hypothetical protein